MTNEDRRPKNGRKINCSKKYFFKSFFFCNLKQKELFQGFFKKIFCSSSFQRQLISYPLHHRHQLSDDIYWFSFLSKPKISGFIPNQMVCRGQIWELKFWRRYDIFERGFFYFRSLAILLVWSKQFFLLLKNTLQAFLKTFKGVSSKKKKTLWSWSNSNDFSGAKRFFPFYLWGFIVSSFIFLLIF